MLRFMLNGRKILKLIIIFFLPLSLGLYVRMYPLIKNPQRRNLALSRLIVHINLKKSIAAKINRELPNLSDEQKNKLIGSVFKSTINKESKNIEKSTYILSQEMAKQPPHFYLLGADSYYYYYLTKKLAADGLFSLKIKEGKYFDPLMLAPLGHWRKIEIHPFMGFFLHKALLLINKQTPLGFTVSSAPLILYLISLIILIGIYRHLRLPAAAISISAVFFSLSPIFILRSSFGWYDSDPYNIIFPLITIYLLFCAAICDKKYIETVLLSLLTCLYSLFWQGWFFLPMLVIISFISIFIFQSFRKEKRRATVKKFLLYLLVTPMISTLLLTPTGFIDSLKDIFAIFTGFLFLEPNLWPDVFLTVGELKTASLTKIIHLSGGFIFFTMAVIGMVASWTKKSSSDLKKEGLLISVFFIFFFLMAKSAERFIIFLVAPLAILFAVGLTHSGNFLAAFLAKRFNKKIGYSVLSALSLLFLITQFIYADLSAAQQPLIYNNVWENTLTFIDKNTPRESIINTWWPPGHFIKAVANRGVTFDGATLNTPQAYWMARFFLAKSEKEALAILKMLNSHANRTNEFLTANNLPLAEAISLISKIILLDKKEARNIAGRYLSGEKNEYLLTLTHPEIPPLSYCLVYKGLIENTLGLYFIKNWDFNKSLDLKNIRQKSLRKGNFFWRGSQENISSMWQIAGGPVYIGQESYEKKREGNNIYFDNGVILNIADREAKINLPEKSLSGIPESLFYIESGKLTEKRLKNCSLKLSVLLLNQSQKIYSSIIAPREIISSIIFRLYYAEGAGLDHFEKITEQEDPSQNARIILYKIAWP
ncbi:MAG: STT3 domain-containing protein [Candidatus Omnitrophota bacterium]